MTATLSPPQALPAADHHHTAPRAGRALRRGVVPGLLSLIALGQGLLALRPGLNKNAFQDEGLYIYIGHRMIRHLLHGASVTERPGSYFSGAPGFYPILAALGDHLAGLQGARAISLAFMIATMLCVYGIAGQLFGAPAGVFAAAAFAVNGSVIQLSHLATYDAMMLLFVAAAAWLAVRSARGDGLLWAPIVGVLLTAAFFAKYAGAVYVPVIAVLAVAVGWRVHRWEVVRRAGTLMLTSAVLTLFLLQVFARDLFRGITSTTARRSAQIYTSVPVLERFLADWVGPWLILAALGGLLLLRTRPALAVVLLLASVAAVVQQVHIHEATSLSKHAAFGLIFAAPLIGHLLSVVCRTTRYIAVPVALAALVALAVSGVHYSTRFLTGWVDDSALRQPLSSAIALNPAKAILGEEPSAQRYELQNTTTPTQWNDTFFFSYDQLTGEQAYADAINQSHFGTIYLSMTTKHGAWIQQYLSTHRTPYRLRAQAPRYLRGHYVGDWLIYVPRITPG